MAVTIDDYVYTGDEENDTATATWHDEEFNLGTGDNEINFVTGASCGYFGNNTVITTPEENLNLVLPSNCLTKLVGDDVVITAGSSKVKYVVTALVTPDVEDTYVVTGPNGAIDISSYISNGRIELPSNLMTASEGQYYAWANKFYNEGNTSNPFILISLKNQDFRDGTRDLDGITLSDFKVEKVVFDNNTPRGVTIKDVTAEYMTAINSVEGEDYSINTNFTYEYNVPSTVTLKNYALDNNGSTVTINGSDIEVNLTEVNKTSYTGTRLNEYVTINSYYSTPNTNETVDLKTGNNTVYVNIGNNNIGNDVITLNENENLKIVFDTSIKEQIEYSINENNIVLTVYAYSSYGNFYDSNAFVDRNIILGTITILNGANKELFESGSTTTLTFETSNGESINYLLYMGDRNSNQNQSLMGTFRDEKFLVGFGNDTVTTNGGNNKILIQRPGNNTINLTKGENSVDTITVSHPGRNVYEPSAYLGRPDPNKFNSVAQSKTVIKDSDHYDTINFYASYDTETEAYIDFYRKESSNDLDVIVRNGAYLCGNTARYTIENYFASDDKINIINSYGYTFAYDADNNKFIRTRTYNNTTTDYAIKKLIEGSATVTGTDNDETLLATGKAEIITGKGNDKIYTTEASDTINVNGSGEKHVIISPNSGNDTIKLSSYKEINAGAGNDVIKATNLKYVTVFGGDGDDKIETNLDGNTIYGGKGSDYLVSKNNNERGDVELVFNDGDGKDYIEIENANVTLKFQDRKNLTDIRYLRYGNDLMINYNSSDNVIIKNYYKEFEGTLADYNNDNDAYQTALAEFNAKKSTYKLLSNTGTTNQLSSAIANVYDLEPSSIITGANNKKNYVNITGRTQVTEVNTFEYDDLIIAKDNSNVVINAGGGRNTVKAENISNSAVTTGTNNDTVEVSGNNVTITTSNGCDTIVAKNITNSTINSGYSENSSLYDDDRVEISGSGNTVIGLKGNDYFKNIKGEESNNTFEFNIGDGQDIVEFDNGVQVLKFNNINKDDVTLQRFGRNLLIKYSGNDYVAIRGYYDANSQAAQHYNLLFNGETNPTALSTFVSEYENEITAIEDTQNASLSIGGTEFADYVEFVGNSNTKYNINTCAAYENDYGDDVVDVTVNNSKVNTYDYNDTIKVTGNGNTINSGAEDDTIEVTGNGNYIYGADYCDLIKVTGNNNLIRSGNSDDDYADTVEVTGNDNTIYTGEDYDNIKVSGEGNLIHGGGDSDYITNDGKNCGNNTIFFGYNEQAYNAGGYDYYEYYDSGLDELEFDRGTQTLKFMSNTMNEIVLKQKGNDLRIHYSNSNSDAAVIKDYFDTTKTKATYILEDSTNATTNLDTFVSEYGDIEQLSVSSPSTQITVSGTKTIDDLNNEYFISGSTLDDHIIANVNNSEIYGGRNDYYSTSSGNDLIEIAGSNNTVWGEGVNYSYSIGANDYIKNIDGKIADNTTIQFRTNDGDDTIDFRGGTQTLAFATNKFNTLNLVKDDKDLVIKYSAQSSVRIIRYFDEALEDKAQYFIKRSKNTGETDADATISLENLIEQNGIIDETTMAIPENSYQTTAAATSNLTGTDNADNIVITNAQENAQVYLEYDPFNISAPVYDYNHPEDFFSFKEPFTYEKDGDDLIINHKGIMYNPAQQQNETITGSIRIENYFKDEFKNIKMMYEGSENTIYDIAEVIRRCVTFDVKGKPNSNNTLVGSKYSDNIVGGSKNDIISTGAGNDTITSGKGKDTINIDGSGDKTVVLKQGDGKTTKINGVINSTSTNIKAEEFNNNQVCWSKKGNDIVLHFLNLDTLTSDDITISDYFREDGSVNNEIKERLKVNNTDFSTSTFSNFVQGKKIKSDDTPMTLVGTAKNDTITSNVGGDTVYAGNGNDTIYVNADSETGGDSHIYTGKGKDKIVIKDSGYETPGTTHLHFKEEEGNKTVILSEKLENLNHSVQLCIEKNNDSYINERKYKKAGNNLLIDTEFGHYDNKINKYVYSTMTITVQNYFTNGHNNMYLQENDSSPNNLSSVIASNGLDIVGKYNKKKKVTEFFGSDKQDRTTGTKKADYITTGAGDDNIIPGKGKDTVYIDGTGYKYIYTNKGDGADTVKLADDVNFGRIYLKSYDVPSESAYKIVNNDLIVYKTYADGDKFTIDSTKITGIKPLDAENPADITYENIIGNGLNISDKLRVDNNILSTNTTLTPYVMNEGKFKKANKITTKADTKNLVLGGKKNDLITLNGSDEVTYTSAGADNITANGNIAKIYAGSGNDTITLKSNNAVAYGGKGNDKILMEGNLTTGENPQPNSAILYTMYYTKGDGNDTIQIGDNFAGRFGINNYGYDYNSYIGTYGCYYSYQIDKNNNFVLYRTDCSLSNNSYSVDNFTTGSITVKGIKAANPDTPITFENIKNAGGGLNISGLFENIDNYSTNMVQGNAKKANTLISNEGVNNLVLGGKKNDIVTVKGTNDNVFTGAGNDTVTIENGSTGGAVVFTGSGKDTVNINDCYSTAVYLGKGNDTVNVNSGDNGIYMTAGEGNNTFTFGDDFEGCKINISSYVSYSNNSTFGLFKSGDDLLIKDSYRNAKKKVKTETQTIKNYFTNADNLESKIKLGYSGMSGYINSYGLNIIGKYDKQQKATIFEGSKYSDIITGTKKKDIVTTGNGNDKIELGKGDDKITINGTGTKNITIANGDGNDSIIFSDDATGTANLLMNNINTYCALDSANGTKIFRIYDSKGTIKTETIDIIKTAEQNVLINGNALSSMPQYQDILKLPYTNKPNEATINNVVAIGGNKTDVITLLGDYSAAYTGKGNDKITVGQGNSVITGGMGDDKIIINSTTTSPVSKVTINHAQGDGNDTVEFAGNVPVQNVTINAFSDINSPNSYALYVSNKTGFIKAGDDLIFSIQKSSNKSETITFKDYFAEENNNPDAIDFKITFKDKNIPATFSNWGLWIDGVYDAVQKATVYDGTTEYKQRYIYNGSGKAIMNGGINSDNYIVTINKKSNLLIGDKSGLDTILMTADKNNLRAFFNVNSSGDVLVNENQNSDNLIIFNKANLTAKNLSAVLNGNGKGVINIDNFFAQNTSSDSFAAGTGCIEQILVSKNMAKNYTNMYNGGRKYIQQINTNNWINSIAESVSSWLTDKGYANTMEVLESGNSKDISSLIKVYAGVKCETVALGG